MARRRDELEAQAAARMVLEENKIDARCAVDPLYWLQNWTKTTDEHAIEKGVPAEKPFPKFEYFRWAMYFMMRPKEYPRQFFPKSREMMTSRSEEHTSELQSPLNLVCRLLLEKKKTR